MPLYHVMFDGKPEVFCHVCRQHKAAADLLPCDDDKGANGECAHVQYAVCDCPDDEHACDICLDFGAATVLRQITRARS
jgi:hypothetical protein